LSMPLVALRLEDVLGDSTVLFCDIWGVLHNGVTAFASACQALIRARATGRIVILLSNAPRPSDSVRKQLQSLGVPMDAFDAIVTSGDVCRTLIAARQPKAFHHLGPDRDRPLFDGLGVESVPLDIADYVLCTGLLDDTCETPEHYRTRLTEYVRRGLPMLCANPDLVIDRGGEEIYCAGALAQLQIELGGTAEIIGKPYPLVYEFALRDAERIAGRSIGKQEILAIGDSARTDLAGAAGFGIACLFVAGGIHAGEFLDAAWAIDQSKAEKALREWPAKPISLMARLA
jgi:HAD superfamily hydrolase (TIGR01459 family)